MTKHTRFIFVVVLIAVIGTSAAARRQSDKGAIPCSNLNTKTTSICQADAIQSLLGRRDIAGSLSLAAAFYEKDASFAGQCHTLMHAIGESAFRLFSEKKRFALTDNTTYCAYGFYHGFMEEMLKRKEPPQSAAAFCDYVDLQLSKKRPDAYLQCFHGIGHGASNSHNPKEWGNDAVIASHAASVCRQVSTNGRELVYCIGGVYNGIANYYVSNEYGFRMDISDPFALCRREEGENRRMCVANLAVAHWNLSGKDFNSTVAAAGRLSDEEKQAAVQEVATKFWKENPKTGSPKLAVSVCRTLPEKFKLSCIRGYVIGMFEYGVPKIEYKEPLALCASGFLDASESDSCYDGMFSFLPKWYSARKVTSICRSMPRMDLEETCLRRLQKIIIPMKKR